MRGHQALIAMRRNGQKPAIAFVDVDAGRRGLPSWAQWQQVSPALCSVDVEASDPLGRIDWRPFVGMTVSVSGIDAERVIAVAKAIEGAGAKRVISSCQKQIGIDEWVAYQTLWVHDTAGIFKEEEIGASA